MPGKFKIVVSDLHLGAGRVPEGNRLEDFESDAAFAAFLAEIAAESDRRGADVELIVNGDGFEMLQVPNRDTFDPSTVYPPEAYRPSSSSASALKMDLMIAGHRPFFAGLADFLRDGLPRRMVTFVAGNHDLHLYWRGVQDRIRDAVGATGSRSSLVVFEARCVNREGIYVEHGNQYGYCWDRLEDMECPLDKDKPGELILTVGAKFLIDVLNQVERERYWIDGVKPIAGLVWYTLTFDFVFAAWVIALILRALPGLVVDGVLSEEEPRADLLRRLENPEQIQVLAEQYEADVTFRAWFHGEVSGILSTLAGVSGVEASDQGTSPDPIALGAWVQAEVRSALYEAARKCAREEGVQIVVFGHTHEPAIEPLPEGGTYINCGTWTWHTDLTGAAKERWRELFEHPERFTGDRVLHYARIDYNQAGQPQGRLLVYEPAAGPEAQAHGVLDRLLRLLMDMLAWLGRAVRGKPSRE